MAKHFRLSEIDTKQEKNVKEEVVKNSRSRKKFNLNFVSKRGFSAGREVSESPTFISYKKEKIMKEQNEEINIEKENELKFDRNNLGPFSKSPVKKELNHFGKNFSKNGFEAFLSPKCSKNKKINFEVNKRKSTGGISKFSNLDSNLKQKEYFKNYLNKRLGNVIFEKIVQLFDQRSNNENIDGKIIEIIGEKNLDCLHFIKILNDKNS